MTITQYECQTNVKLWYFTYYRNQIDTQIN